MDVAKKVSCMTSVVENFGASSKRSVVQPFIHMTGHNEKMDATNFALPVDPLTITSMQMIGSSFVDANMSFFALLVAWIVLGIKFAGVHAWSTTSCRLSTCFLMWYLTGSLPLILLAWLFPCFGRSICNFINCLGYLNRVV